MNLADNREWISASRIHDLLASLSHEGTDLEANRGLRAVLQAVLRTGTSARRARPDLGQVQALRCEHPHFAHVLDLYEGEVLLSLTAGARPQAMPPVLLLGEPGVGKTRFALALAQALGAPLRCHDMSAASAGFGLGGLDRGWSTGRPGAVFDVLHRTGVLNPVILLDEIDKASADVPLSPLGPLYQLLEPATAQQFTDEFIGLPFDASQVSWIATANEAHAVPAALRSRMTLFTVAAPGPDAMAAMVERMFAQLCRQLPSLHPRLPAEVHVQLATCTPREAQRRLRSIVRHAAVRAWHTGRATISISRLDAREGQDPDRPARLGFV